MKQASTRELFAYWSKQRGGRVAPERGDIDPAAIRHALSDIFILASDFVEEQRFRLAGTRLCALFGRELKGESFSSLWAETSRAEFRNTLTGVVTENASLVAGVTGRNADGNTVDLELLLLPLAHKGHARVRAIGVLAAIEMPYWVGTRPIKQLVLGTVRHGEPQMEQTDARTSIADPGEGQMRRGFMVYQGGRINPPSEKAG
jgi:hypothetical protein